MFEIQKANGKTNMDDYFLKYLQEKKNMLEEKNMELKLPFQTALPNSILPINQQGNFTSNIQNINYSNLNPMMKTQPINNLLNNQNNLKVNLPNLFSNPNMPINCNNPNIHNFNKILLYQNQQRLQPQNNMNMNFNNLIGNNTYQNNTNLIGLKNINPSTTATNFGSNMHIQNIINSNQQNLGFNNLQSFQNLTNNMNQFNHGNFLIQFFTHKRINFSLNLFKSIIFKIYF